MTNHKKQTNARLRREARQLRERIRILDTLVTERQSFGRLLERYEHDRQLIGYEIYDGLPHQAIGTWFQLQILEQQLQAAPESICNTLQTAMATLRLCIDEARRLINAVRPPLLEESGLKTAIECLIAKSESLGGLTVQLLWELNLVEVPPRLAHAVFRIVQECLANVRRHSMSSGAQVRLSQLDDRLVVEVKDWGVGFDPTVIQSSGVGLEGTRLRARLFGGAARITSLDKQGTTVVVELALHENITLPAQTDKGTE